jgi:hypothetical protein
LIVSGNTLAIADGTDFAELTGHSIQTKLDDLLGSK